MDIAKVLHEQAGEIAKANLNGWGNTMMEAAAYIAALEERMSQAGLAECPECGSFDIEPGQVDANGEPCADVCKSCGAGF